MCQALGCELWVAWDDMLPPPAALEGQGHGSVPKRHCRPWEAPGEDTRRVRGAGTPCSLPGGGHGHDPHGNGLLPPVALAWKRQG